MFTARHILYTKDVTIDSNATADFHATTEVMLLPGFDSKRGSNTIAYIAPVDFDCGALHDGTKYFKTDEAEEQHEETPLYKSIDVHYSLGASSIRLVPNPAANTVYLETDESGSCTVEITDMAGSKVYNSKFYLAKQASIDVSAFAVGTYNVLVSMNKRTETFKLIINH